ncbi:hypothetical protein CDCA_CDCA18G4509 [Cyanidium caldarium]|uniref:Uncharacterized protein n=1 Tax=Cyanidium caldarium TaxID=2771 RepID=A0AAV9J1W9_CYACA|nr:hypothetical protein CDCA_CDCA18G4509 [Cyanidium caldarium]
MAFHVARTRITALPLFVLGAPTRLGGGAGTDLPRRWPGRVPRCSGSDSRRLGKLLVRFGGHSRAWRQPAVVASGGLWLQGAVGRRPRPAARRRPQIASARVDTFLVLLVAVATFAVARTRLGRLSGPYVLLLVAGQAILGALLIVRAWQRRRWLHFLNSDERTDVDDADNTDDVDESEALSAAEYIALARRTEVTSQRLAAQLQRIEQTLQTRLSADSAIEARHRDLQHQLQALEETLRSGAASAMAPLQEWKHATELRVAELRERLQALRERYSSLRDRNRELGARLQDAEAERQREETTRRALERRVAELEAEHRRQAAHLDAMNGKLFEANAQMEVARSQIVRAKRDYRQLRRERDALRARLDALWARREGRRRTNANEGEEATVSTAEESTWNVSSIDRDTTATSSVPAARIENVREKAAAADSDVDRVQPEDMSWDASETPPEEATVVEHSEYPAAETTSTLHPSGVSVDGSSRPPQRPPAPYRYAPQAPERSAFSFFRREFDEGGADGATPTRSSAATSHAEENGARLESSGRADEISTAGHLTTSSPESALPSLRARKACARAAQLVADAKQRRGTADAEAWLRQALEVFQRHTDERPPPLERFHAAHGEALLELSRYDGDAQLLERAEQQFAAACDLNATDSASLFHWARALSVRASRLLARDEAVRAAELYAAAAVKYRAFLQMHPMSVAGRFNYGLALLGRARLAGVHGDQGAALEGYAAAREQFAQVLDMAPDDAQAREYLACCEREQQRVSSAG